MRAKGRKNLELTEILGKRESGASLGRRAKKRTNEEQRHGSSYRYVEIEADHEGRTCYGDKVPKRTRIHNMKKKSRKESK